MRITFTSAVIFSSATAIALSQPYVGDRVINYDGDQVYRIATNGDAKAVFDAIATLPYELWNDGNAGHLDIAVSKDELDNFKALGLDLTIMHENLGTEITRELDGATAVFKRDGLLPSESWFDSYHSYDEHVQYWEDLHIAFFNNSIPFVAGQSYEGRNIFGLRLYAEDIGQSERPAIIWHGTVHAREWITTMTLEYIAFSIIEGYKADNDIYTSILDRFDIYILPIVNPDGFIYSQTKDRLWRKNRSPTPIPGRKKDICYGTDINRNWPYQWRTSNTSLSNGATSSNPCSQSFRGSSPSSSPETRALASHMLSIASKQPVALYLDFHAYGNYILSPYGYTSEQEPWNSAAEIALAEKAAARIKEVHGEEYTVGSLAERMYTTTGLGMDFAKDVAGAEFAYTLELGDGNKGGFVLRPSEIRPTGAAVLEGVKVLLEGIGDGS